MDNTLHTIDAGDLMRAEWIDKRDGLIAAASELVAVNNQQALDAAGGIISDSAKHRKELNAARLVITRQIDGVKRQIMDQERELSTALDGQEQRLRDLSSAYLTEQDRQRREIEAAAELQRRQAAEALLERDQEARAAFGSGVAVATPMPAPIEPVKTRPTTAGTTTAWKFELVDPAIVPRAYLVPNDKAIRSAIRAMVDQGLTPQIDGLRIFSIVGIRARG